MFGSRADRIQRANEDAANTKRRADTHRKETNDGVRNALSTNGGLRRPDHDFIRNWKPPRDANQAHLDARAADAAKEAKKAKRSWW